MSQKIQSDQLVIDQAKKDLKTAPRQEYETVMTVLDDSRKKPGNVSLESVSGTNTIIQIESSPLQKLRGQSDQSVSGADFEILAGISNNFRQYPESFLDVADGSVTGAISVLSTPTTTDGFWRWMLITAKSTEDSWSLTFGEEVSGMPAFGELMPSVPRRESEVAFVRLQNSGGGSWNFLRPSEQDFYTVAKGGGSSDGGGGGGAGGELIDLQFIAQIQDDFESAPDSASVIDTSAGKTDATTYSLVNGYYRIAYDADVAVSGNGSEAVLTGGAPAFTVQEGDVLVVGDEVVSVSGIGSVNSDGGLSVPMQLAEAFSVAPDGASGVNYMIGQAIHTVDLNNYDEDGEGLSIGSQITSDLQEALVAYTDTEADGDTQGDWGSPALLAYSMSADGVSYSPKSARTTNLTDQENIVTAPNAGTNFYLRFFANKTSGNGFVNLLDFKAFWHEDQGETLGESYFTAFARPTSGVAVACTHSVLSGKSRFVFNEPYGRGLNDGDPAGSALEVYVNGQLVPRYEDGTLVDTGSGFFKEIDDVTIEMDQDYTSEGVNFQFKVPRLVIDSRTTNTSDIADIKENIVEAVDPVIAAPMIDVPNTIIEDRAQILDFSRDLGLRMGINRIPITFGYYIPNERGPNGELVWGVENDPYGQIRIIQADGTIFANHNANNNSGAYLGTTQGDSIEITFYGTGLNVLIAPNAGTTNFDYYLDGVLQSTIDFGGANSILGGNDWNSNVVKNIANGLTEGLHTIRLLNDAGNSNIYGVEILNESTELKVNPGTSYAGGKALALSSQYSSPYDSDFESGTSNGNGGSVLVYQKSNGTIAKSINPVANAQSNMGSADHSNEQVARNYYWHEFCDNNPDDFDFENIGGSSTEKTFVMNDGTATLSGDGVFTYSSGAYNSINISNASSNILRFTFIGSGLDLLLQFRSTGSGGANVEIDGVNIGSFTGASGDPERVEKIVSGLPYGTHILTLTTTGSANFGVKNFIVYEPKTPALPLGAVPIGSYNLFADYDSSNVDGSSSTSSETYRNVIAQGVLRKQNVREFYVTGTFDVLGVGVPNNQSGYFVTIQGGNSGDLELVFFGTGCIYNMAVTGSGARTFTVEIDGVANDTGVFLGSNSTSTNNGSGGYTVSNSQSARLEFTGLPLGFHTIKVIVSATTGATYSDSVDVITPIHSYKYSKANIQNTIDIGSQGILDLRNFKNPLAFREKANYAKSRMDNVTTSITNFVKVPGSGVHIYSRTGRVEVTVNTNTDSSSGSPYIEFALYINGNIYGPSSRDSAFASLSGDDRALTITEIFDVPVGYNYAEVYWVVSSGTARLISSDTRVHIKDI